MFVIYITKHNIQFLHDFLLIFKSGKTVSYAAIFFFKNHYIDDDKMYVFFNVNLPTNISKIVYRMCT